jgi:hypothetical protein
VCQSKMINVVFTYEVFEGGPPDKDVHQ